jgi:RecG-like helicase
MGLLKRHKVDLTETCEPCMEVGDVTPIGELTARTPVRITGEVTRMKTRPGHGLPALTVTVQDDTGKALVIFSGRRAIGGVTLGRWLLIEGVAYNRGGALEFVNPVYTLLPRPGQAA